jgi:NADH:ubiquinone oxidoreductase subunit 6 (subunit J)
MMNLVFYFFAFILIASALYAVASKNLIRSVFALFLSFFSVSGILVFAHSDFLAVTQILVYVGGILVVMLFGIMLSNRNVLDLIKNTTIKRNVSANQILSLILVSCFLIILSVTISNIEWNKMLTDRSASTIESVGVNLMTTYLLPFEIISIVLLAALIGAAYIARRAKTEEE